MTKLLVLIILVFAAIFAYAAIFADVKLSIVSAQSIVDDYFHTDRISNLDGLGYRRILPLLYPFDFDYLITFESSETVRPENFEDYKQCNDSEGSRIREGLASFGNLLPWAGKQTAHRSFIAKEAAVLKDNLRVFECYQLTEKGDGSFCSQRGNYLLFEPAAGKYYFSSKQFGTCPM